MFQEEGDRFDPLCGELARFEVWGREGPGGRAGESLPWGDWGTIMRLRGPSRTPHSSWRRPPAAPPPPPGVPADAAAFRAPGAALHFCADIWLLGRPPSGMFQEEGDRFDHLCGELARFEV